MQQRCPITVVIADDHRLFRESLRTLLETDGDISVVGEANNGREAMTVVRTLRPDLLLLDFAMPVMGGLAMLRELSTLTPAVRTLVLTAGVADSDLVEALRLRARGVLLKQSSPELLFRSIRAVVAGEYWVGRDRIGDLIEQMRAGGAVREKPGTRAVPGFTRRQLDVVAAIANGLTNREIAERFSISPRTVKYHLTQIFEQTGVSNRLELALYAVEHRLDRAGDER